MSGYDLYEMLFRIKKIKKEKGITNDMLSQISAISIGTLNKILAGVTKEPSIESIIKIAKALEVPADYLILGSVQSSLNDEEQKLITAYRSAHPEMQKAVNRILNIDDIPEQKQLYSYASIAAKGHGTEKHLVSDEQRKLAVKALHDYEVNNK